MQTIFLSAAYTQPFLEELAAEIHDIRNALRSLEERRVWRVVHEPTARLNNVFDTFNRNGANIHIFHYAGHASQNEIHLPGGGNIEGIAQLFGLSEPDKQGHNPLQFVFLNGCSSAPMLKDLHRVGVKAVIATSCQIGDKTARDFASAFYRNWSVEGVPLQKAFELAVAYLKSSSGASSRNIEIRGTDYKNSKNAELPWGLYIHPELTKSNQEEVLNWQINPKGIISQQPLADHNNTKDFSLRVGHFVGREQIIENVKSNFLSGKRIQILHGMDGNGKTRLVAEYCDEMERTGHYSELIWWFHAQIPSMIQNEITLLAERLFPDYEITDFNETKIKLFDWFREKTNWVIVFDDAKDEKMISEYLPEGNGHILITSSNKTWHMGLPDTELVEVPCLDIENAALLLLLRTNGRLSESKAKEWAGYVEGYPIVLEMLSDFFMDGSQSEEQFSSILLNKFVTEHDNQKRLNFFVNSAFDDLPSHLMKGIARKHGFAYSLYLFSWLHNQKIPRYLFSKIIDQSVDYFSFEGKLNFFSSWFNKWLQSAKIKAEESKSRLLSALLRRSMIFEVGYDSFSVNTFVQEIFFYRSLLIPKFFLKNFLENLSNLLADELYAISKLDDFSEKEIRQNALLPHAIKFLDNIRNHNREIIEIARLARRLGKIFISKGQFMEAKNYSEYAYKIEKRFNGKASSWTLDDLLESTLFTGEFGLFRDLLSERKTHSDFSLSEALLKEALERYFNGRDHDALQLIEQAVNASKSIENEDYIFDASCLLAGLVGASINQEKSENYLKQAENKIIELHSKSSKEYADFLSVAAAAHLRMNFHLLDTDPSEAYRHLEMSYDFYNEAYDIFTQYQDHSNSGLMALMVEKLLCTVAYGEIEEAEDMCKIIEEHRSTIIKGWGEDSFILANYEFALSGIEYEKGNSDLQKAHLQKAHSILLKFFKGDTNHKQIIEVEKLLSALE